MSLNKKHMLMVVDAGSTKADWFLSDGNRVVEKILTIGFNPYFHTSDFVYETLNDHTVLKANAASVSEIRYFGAGCSSDERNRIIANALSRFFTGAEVHVDHDLLGSVYATCGDEEGISCILGTGSNSCYFDGKKVHDHNYGLGYILGDEGSGSYYGKKLVTTYLYGLMPDHIYKAFRDEYKLDKDSIIGNVYGRPGANVWLASLSKFIGVHRQDPFIQTLLQDGMDEFMELYVCNYRDYRNMKVHFVGSIAFLYQDELRAAAARHSVTVGKIIRRPIEELMKYFLQKFSEKE